ncbi:MAG: alkaline phosphatase family protein [Clostridia bacterium]|nr:alkaline phosphatase family protein [Clostridia bacterium]
MGKVHMILVDGMRPDALALCTNPFIRTLLDNSLYTLSASTVFPSVTLPCHMSLFHSVDPDRHGVTTNTYTPQVRPIKGLMEQLTAKRIRTAMIYNWEELRDLYRPGGVMHSCFVSMHFDYGMERSNEAVTEATLRCIRNFDPDFCFTYLGWTDEEGHAFGWMGEKYLHSIDESFRSIERIMEAQDEDYITIILADHGGHGRHHGTEMPEDMTIPVIIHGKGIQPGLIDHPVSIKDIAPTITHLLGCENAPEWEGSSLL